MLGSIPAVISVGKRCMNMGYSFHWPSGKNPFLVCPDGMIVELDVHGDIPYLRSGSKKSAPKTPTREIIVPSVHCVEPPRVFISGAGADGSGSGGDSAEPEDELSETDLADPTAEYNEVEKLSLREAALAIEHKLTHRVKNVFCDSCVRGIMKNKRTKVGAFDRELTHWGQLLTSDHIDSKTKKQTGLVGEKEAYVIKDVFSGLVCLYPAQTKDGADTEICVRHFTGIPGIRKPKDVSMYSDQSGEIRVACRSLGILHDNSQPGVPQTNALIERTSQMILTKTIVALLEDGLPPCYWSFAAPCVCVNLNTEFENGDSAYFLTHGVEFPFRRFPFGCKVLYKPSATKSSEVDGKWSAPSSVGIVAGYVMHPGYKSKGEYLVWDLFDFGRGADLSNLASSMYH